MACLLAALAALRLDATPPWVLQAALHLALAWAQAVSPVKATSPAIHVVWVDLARQLVVVTTTLPVVQALALAGLTALTCNRVLRLLPAAACRLMVPLVCRLVCPFLRLDLGATLCTPTAGRCTERPTTAALALAAVYGATHQPPLALAHRPLQVPWVIHPALALAAGAMARRLPMATAAPPECLLAACLTACMDSAQARGRLQCTTRTQAPLLVAGQHNMVPSDPSLLRLARILAPAKQALACQWAVTRDTLAWPPHRPLITVAAAALVAVVVAAEWALLALLVAAASMAQATPTATTSSSSRLCPAAWADTGHWQASIPAHRSMGPLAAPAGRSVHSPTRCSQAGCLAALCRTPVMLQQRTHTPSNTCTSKVAASGTLRLPTSTTSPLLLRLPLLVGALE